MRIRIPYLTLLLAIFGGVPSGGGCSSSECPKGFTQDGDLCRRPPQEGSAGGVDAATSRTDAVSISDMEAGGARSEEGDSAGKSAQQAQVESKAGAGGQPAPAGRSAEKRSEDAGQAAAAANSGDAKARSGGGGAGAGGRPRDAATGSAGSGSPQPTPQSPTPQAGNARTPASSISAVYQPIHDQLEVLGVGADGTLRVLWKGTDQKWQSAFDLSGAGFAPPRAPVAVAYQPLNEQLEAFVVGQDGVLYVLWKEHSGDWHAPFALTAAGFAAPGAGVAAVYQPLNQHLEIFVPAKDGSLHVLWKADNKDWNMPFQLAPAGSLSATSQLTAAYYPTNENLEVFYVDRQGALQVVWKEHDAEWKAAFALTPAGFAEPGAPLSVSYQPLNEQLELFLFGKDGKLELFWKDHNKPWEGPYQLAPAGSGPSNGHVASAFSPLNNQMAALFVDTQGALQVAQKAQNMTWEQPVPLTERGVLAPGAHVALAYYPFTQQYEGFASGPGDDISLVWKPSGAAWMGPLSLR